VLLEHEPAVYTKSTFQILSIAGTILKNLEIASILVKL